MKEENTRKHYLRFERLRYSFNAETEAEPSILVTSTENSCNLKTWRDERAKRRIATEQLKS